MTKTMFQPKLISIEGGEGAGKSTAITAIVAFLTSKGFPVVSTREPGGTPLGEQLRAVVLNPAGAGICPMAELLVMFAARAQHLVEVIQPALSRGDWVVTDRFTDSSYAYQGAGRGIPDSTISDLEGLVVGFAPDLTLFLDVDPGVGMSRVQARGQPADRIEQESSTFFDDVHRGFLSRAEQFPDRFRIIDASQAPEKVSDQVSRVLQAWIDTHAA